MPMPAVGDVVGPLDVGPVAHGGHFVAHHDGRVLFVRHALPGERVTVRLTQVNASVLRGDAIEIQHAADDRVEPPCTAFGPGGCGGCDFQHIAVARQRELKADVLRDQLRRLARLEWDGEVEAVPGDDGGLGWRTRARYLVSAGRLGMRAHRSHRFVALPAEGCLLAVPALRRPALADGRLERVRESRGRGGRGQTRERELVVMAGPDGRPLARGAATTLRVGERPFRLTGESFWQVHPGAAAALAEAVVTGLAPAPGETALDLYCGAGLFVGVLAERGVAVAGVEGNSAAVALARRNVPEASFAVGDVARALVEAHATDLVVLDPPRVGAGRAVMAAILARAPRAVAYVACDPAALARDLADLPPEYAVTSIRAFDLFPMTQHVETVAILSRR
ncbi:class I SAM-dependent RNA methyltransferase [Propionicicella superfundia]|uniref:class I SAM-dependent RNA methyltransferase n=1 Tax=Propionicicella superfundia TaxID=348582 RepID=UPI000684AB0A|nr:TRAM domain-containing protein [Propionicicella superfundia]